MSYNRKVGLKMLLDPGSKITTSKSFRLEELTFKTKFGVKEIQIGRDRLFELHTHPKKSLFRLLKINKAKGTYKAIKEGKAHLGIPKSSSSYSLRWVLVNLRDESVVIIMRR